MTTYLVYYVCTPVEGTPQYNLYAKARFFVWVLETGQIEAERKALKHVTEFGWKIESCEGVHIFTREIAAQHPDNLRGFEAVQRSGLFSECITSPAGDAPRFN